MALDILPRRNSIYTFWLLIILASGFLPLPRSAKAQLKPSSVPLPLDLPLMHLGESQGLSSPQVTDLAQDSSGTIWCATPQGLDQYRQQRFKAHYNSSNTALLADDRLTTASKDLSGRLWFGTHRGVALYTDPGFVRFGPSAGLAHRRLICALAASPDGMWFGTWGGISLYQNHRFVAVAQDILPQAPVNALYRDSHGALWIGYLGGGLWRYTAGKAVPVGRQQGKDKLEVQSFLQDRADALWIGTSNNGLVRYDAQSAALHPTDFPASAALSLYQDPSGPLWVGSNKGLFNYTTEVWHSRGPPSIARAPIHLLHSSPPGQLWIGTWGNGLWHKREDKIEPVALLANRRINAVQADSQGRLWTSTDQGLFWKGPAEWQKYPLPDHLGELGTLLEDDRNRLWIATQRRGLVRLDRDDLVHFSPRHRLPEAQIHTLVPTADGLLWLGTAAGLVSFDGEQFIPHTRPAAAVYALEATPSGDLWIGTETGLFLRRNGQISQVLKADQLPAPAIRTLALAADQSLWLGTRAGLGHLIDGQLEILTNKQGLPHENIRDLALDGEGRLWIATSGGLALLDKGRFTVFTTANGLTNNLLFSLLIDRAGGIWVGSLAGGAVRYDGQRFYHLTTREGLPSNTVRRIFQDRDGHIWLATDKGLSRYHRNAIPPLPRRREWVLPLAGLLIGGASALLVAQWRQRKNDSGLRR
ncbi:MAG: hypothetical protein GKR89_21245 [Candidatus Latescibacteria bacterium]|nr:hypothetical protein [Candidatus Latescibacterota bacterium]